MILWRKKLVLHSNRVGVSNGQIQNPITVQIVPAPANCPARNVISFGLFISPVPTILKIIQKKSVEEFKPDPYLATLLNCMFWIFYGQPFVHPHSTLVVTINGIGFALEFLYTTDFFIYSNNNKQRLRIFGIFVGELLFFMTIATLTLVFAHTHEKRSMIIGTLCVVFGVMMYCSPLTIMHKVIVTKSVEYMPFFLSLANFLNGSVWLTYALIRFDLYITISNGLGAVSGAVQLILYACYYKSTPKRSSNESSEVQMVGSKV
ncbi:hypothetical protein HHK36_007071 [Tetracentron sinense]|uniref:Bidirectional sugar transporter SWEET n=1 Tax=Tetracentron sinense TaxID=13715 RepID=A0A834ZQX8_TETSI|nr:hypothetical protein HHK36_007071 [Tetracentron sinense]